MNEVSSEELEGLAATVGAIQRIAMANSRIAARRAKAMQSELLIATDGL